VVECYQLDCHPVFTITGNRHRSLRITPGTSEFVAWISAPSLAGAKHYRAFGNPVHAGLRRPLMIPSDPAFAELVPPR